MRTCTWNAAPTLLHMEEVWSYIFKEGRAVSRNGLVILMIFASPNANILGVLMMLSPMMPEMFETIAGTFVIPFYPPCEPPSEDIILSSHFARTNALQYTDVILTLLHCFIKCNGSCTRRYRYYVSITIVQSYTGKYQEFVAVVLLQVWSTSINAKGDKIDKWYFPVL